MITNFLIWTGLWALIIMSAVIGRIIDESNSQDEGDSTFITREQVKEWSEEFFSRAEPYPEGSTTSYLEQYSENTKTSNRNGKRLGPQSDSVSRRPAVVNHDNLEWMLRNIFTYPRSHSTNSTAKEIVKKYIAESFEYTSGLPTTIQYFEPQQFLNMYDDVDLPVGANVIAILKGTNWSTSEDRPIVVGAHWDTVNFTPGTDDNGSGVAAMLEAARVIAHSGCIPKHSIIFVAFDLEETGSQGSLLFIKEFLIDLLMSSGLTKKASLSNFQGAFILDSIMNFNDTAGSQTFPKDWSLLLPEVYDDVANEHYRGDFLSVIHRKDVDKDLASKFLQHWTSAPQSHLKIKSFPLSLAEELPDLETLSANINFLRSDHARFWYMNDTEVPRTLSAVLLTDTGPYRGNMRECYHSVCDGPEISVYDNKPNIQFLAKATQALVDTLVEMSDCDIGRSETTHLQKVSGNGASARSDSPVDVLTRLFKWFQKR